MRFHVRYLCAFIFLVGCQGSDSRPLEVIFKDGMYIHNVSPDQNRRLTAEGLGAVEVIPLEATDNSLISNVLKVERDSTSGHWYILDNENPMKILVFDEAGKFVRNIRHTGSGPGEYTQIDDFYLRDGEWVEIFDRSNQRLTRYDLATDTVAGEKRVPFYAYKYSYLPDGNYVFYKNNQAVNLEDESWFYNLLVLDPEFELVQKALPFSMSRGINISIMNPLGLVNTHSGALYSDFHADTLYLASSDTIKPHHILDFGHYTIPDPEVTFASSREKLNYYVELLDDHIIGASHIHETDTFFSFNFLHNDNVYFYYYDKLNDTPHLFDEIEVESIYLPPPVQMEESTFISIYTLEMLHDKIDRDQLNEASEFHRALMQGMAYDNPVLVLYHLEIE